MTDDGERARTGPQHSFQRSIAYVIGVNRYDHGIPALNSAVLDAEAIAWELRDQHGFEVELRRDSEATKEEIEALLARPLSKHDRLLFYFAGHGIGLDGDDGPSGYLLLDGARRNAPETYFPMRELHRHLMKLACRHCLVILDCCFAGAFRWSGLRDVGRSDSVVYQEKFQRFVDSRAYQVLTSASHDQRALDRLSSSRGERASENEGASAHSPFAEALLAGLRGSADLNQDGLITASELSLYLRDGVEPRVMELGYRQSPQIFVLGWHEYGEFVFQSPERELSLPSAPSLDQQRNPYRGLASYEPDNHDKFFGRDATTALLLEHVTRTPLTVVVGPSGVGKSSAVKAGLIAALRQRCGWRALSIARPGAAPLTMLDAFSRELGGAPAAGDGVLRSFSAATTLGDDPARGRVILVVDQLEELVTDLRTQVHPHVILHALAQALRNSRRLRVIVTLRADTEPALSDQGLEQLWQAGRFVLPRMRRAGLREAIEGPALASTMYFQPPSLVERILDDVAELPAPLPLLSFALSELYAAYWQRQGTDRALRESDYDQIGSAAGALTRRATAVYRELSKQPGYDNTVRNVITRMISTETGEPSRRRVLLQALKFDSGEENLRVAEVLKAFDQARLISLGTTPIAGDSDVACVEPMHDELIRGWELVPPWLKETWSSRTLLASLEEPSRTWARHDEDPELTWHSDPRLEMAASLARQPQPLLNSDEMAFVRASLSVRRRRTWRRITTIAATAVVVATALAAGIWQWSRAEEQKTVAKVAKSTATSRRLSIISERLAEPRGDLALLLAAAAYDSEPTVEAESALLTALLVRPRLQRYVHGHSDATTSIAFDKAGERMMTGDLAGYVSTWDAATMRRRQPFLAHQPGVATAGNFAVGGVMGVAFAGAQEVITAGADGQVKRWHLDKGTLLWTHDSFKAICAMALSPDGDLLAIATLRSAISRSETYLLDARRGTLVRRLAVEDTYALTFSPDGAELLTGGEDRNLRRWRVSDGQRIGSPVPAHELPISALAFDPTGKLLASAGMDHHVRIWAFPELTATDSKRRFPEGAMRSLAFSFDGRKLVGGTTGGDVVIWRFDLDNAEWMPHSDIRTSLEAASISATVAVRPGTDVLASTGPHGFVAAWNLRWSNPIGRVVPTRGLPDGQPMIDRGLREMLAMDVPDLNAVAWSQRGHLALGGEGGMIEVLGAADREISAGDAVSSLAFSPSGDLLAIGLRNGTLRVLEAQGWTVRCERADAHVAKSSGPNRQGVEALAFDDANALYSGGADGEVRKWSTLALQGDGPRLCVPQGAVTSIAGVFALELTSNGRELIAAGNEILRLALPSLRVVHRQPMPDSDATDATFASDTLLVTSTNDSKLVMWSLEHGLQLRGSLYRHATSVPAVAADPARRRLFTGGDDGNIAVWDIDLRQPIGPMLNASTGAVWDLALSPDGTELISVSTDSEVRRWSVSPTSWRRRACEVANRNLTCAEWNQYLADEPYASLCPELPAPIPPCAL
jgi:WD40 repeat protein